MRKLLVFTLLIASPTIAGDSPDSIVRYRQSVMKAMGAHMKAMSLVVNHQYSRREQLAAHADAIRSLSAGIAELFPAGTGSDRVRTAAQPAIWKRQADFDAAVRNLQRESERLAGFARGSDTKAFDTQFRAVDSTCMSCHKTFRERDQE